MTCIRLKEFKAAWNKSQNSWALKAVSIQLAKSPARPRSLSYIEPDQWTNIPSASKRMSDSDFSLEPSGLVGNNFNQRNTVRKRRNWSNTRSRGHITTVATVQKALCGAPAQYQRVMTKPNWYSWSNCYLIVTPIGAEDVATLNYTHYEWCGYSWGCSGYGG